jgi:hypothetical protein
MDNLHKYRNRKAKFGVNRLVFDEKPADVVAAFEGKDIAEKTPKGIDVDKEKQAALDRLNKIPKDKRTDAEYNKAKKDIEARATVLKAKQKYYAEKVAVGDKLSKPYGAVNSPSGYEKATADAATFARLSTLQTEAGIAGDVNYEAKQTEAREAQKAYATKIKNDLQNSRDALNRILNPKEGDVISDEEKLLLRNKVTDLDQLNRTYQAIKSKDSKAFDPTAEELYKDTFNLVNLWSARDAKKNLSPDASDELKKSTDQWLGGAELLNKLRLARGNAMANWQALVDLGKVAESVRNDLVKPSNPAQKAWDEAKKVEQTDYDKAAKQYNEAGRLYKEALVSVEKLNDSNAATAAKDAAQKYWDENVKGKSFEAGARAAGDAHWKAAETAMKAKPVDYLAAKTNYDLAKADYENFVRNESLQVGKKDAEVKTAEQDYENAKKTFETVFARYPDRKEIAYGLMRKFSVSADDNNDVKFSKYKERARICVEAVAAIGAWQRQQDAFNAQSGRDVTAGRLYDEAETCFRRGDFASAIEKYNQEAKIYENRKANPADKKKSMAVDETGVLREFSEAEAKMAYDKIANAMGQFPDIAGLLKPHFDTAQSFWNRKSFAGAFTEYREINRLVEGAKVARALKNKVGPELKVGSPSPSGMKLGTVEYQIYSDEQKDSLAFNHLKARGDDYFNMGNFTAAKSMYDQAIDLKERNKSLPASSPLVVAKGDGIKPSPLL